MRFLADENVPSRSVAFLRAHWHEVVWVAEASPGLNDHEIWNWAAREKRILLTFDLDFGLILRSSNDFPPGIVIFRFAPSRPEEPGQRLVHLLDQGVPLEGHLVVLGKDFARIRKLPRP